VRDAQSRGACIVSFNANAFTSFGKVNGANAPVAANKVYAYTLALNHMLASDRHKVQIADATTVFWAEAPSPEIAGDVEALIGLVLSGNAPDAVANANVMTLLERIAQGRPLADIHPSLEEAGAEFHVVGLSPNAARIAIRFWHADSFAHFAANLRQHYFDLKIEPQPWKTPPSVWRLLLQTAPQRKSEHIPPMLAGAVMRAIMTGQPYPQTLLVQLLMRIRADHVVNGLRAALLKACLLRRRRQLQGTHRKENDFVSLDRNESNQAYRLGRLFAVLEAAQKAALGNINATILNRFYASASATPAMVFPMLIRNSKNHLADLRRGRAADWVRNAAGTGYWLDNEMAAILDGFGSGFPSALAIQDQGRFAIGYYHQRFSRHVSGATEAQADDGAEEIENREGIEA
jgi:CRISPR-associated protein Csd1